MSVLVDHPFFVGLGLSVLLAMGITSLGGAMTPAAARGVGLIVYGAALGVLLWFGLDRENVFWFLLGSLLGIVVSWMLTM